RRGCARPARARGGGLRVAPSRLLLGLSAALELAADDLLVRRLLGALVGGGRRFSLRRRDVVVLAPLLRLAELALDLVDQLLDAAVRVGVGLVRDEPLVVARPVQDHLPVPRIVDALEHDLDARIPAEEFLEARTLVGRE